MNKEISSQEIKYWFGLPKTFSQARQQAKKYITECLEEKLAGRTDPLVVKYEAADWALGEAYLFVSKCRDRYYTYTEEMKQPSRAFTDCSRFIYEGSKLFWVIQPIGDVSSISNPKPEKCFHRVGNSAISAALRYCSNIWGIWANFVRRDLDYGNIKEDFLEQDFHKPEVIDYILEWRSYVNFELEDTLPSEQWPDWLLRQETERVSCLLKTECHKPPEDNSQQDGTMENLPHLKEEEVGLLKWANEQYPSIFFVKQCTEFDDKTNYKSANHLVELGLFEKPKNKKRGCFITKKGRQLAEEYYS